MIKNEIKFYETFMKALEDGVKPALGCTEPVAVGLAVAKAYSVVGGDIEKIEVSLSPNIFKNGLAVGIPGTDEIGLVFATALAAECGDSNLGLEVFKPVNDECIKEAKKMVEKNIINIDIEKNEGNFYIEAQVNTSKGLGVCKIRDKHTNIVHVSVNDDVIYESGKAVEKFETVESNIKNIEVKDIREFVENVPYEDIKFLLEGVELNKAISNVGLREKSGTGLGSALKELIDEEVVSDDLINRAKYVAAAACDARMAGVNMPVMSSGGSGNQGITAIIPVTIVCEDIGCNKEKLARTLAYSHIMTAYIKSFVGNLSPVCGCAISAGIGASAAITWTLGGSEEEIAGAIKNMIGTLTGLVCDGAKGGCAFKISTATSEAIIQAKLAMKGIVINSKDGILHKNIEETIKNLGQFSSEGMKCADEEIIKIMLKD